MSTLRAALAEIIGLFVDDASYAVAIVAWLGLCGLVLSRLPVPGPWPGVALFAGLAGILVVSARRRAGR